MLCVLDCRLRVVYFCLTFTVRCMEAKLDFVNSIHKSKERLYSAFDCAHELFVSILRMLVMETCHRDKHVELSNEVEIAHSYSNRCLVVKTNMVHEGFQV